MDLIEFSDISNYYRLKFNISSLKNNQIKIKKIKEYIDPDIYDPLQRIFYVYIIISNNKLGIATQPIFYSSLKKLVKEIYDIYHIYDKIDDIKNIISKKLLLPVENIISKNNLLFLKNSSNCKIKLRKNNIRKLTVNDLEDANNLIKDSAFSCSINTINNGFAFGYFQNNSLISIAYSLTPKNPDINSYGENIVIYTDVNYRGKGFGKLTLSNLINEIASNKKIAMYGCSETNISSIKTANSLDFTLMGKSIRFFS